MYVRDISKVKLEEPNFNRRLGLYYDNIFKVRHLLGICLVLAKYLIYATTTTNTYLFFVFKLIYVTHIINISLKYINICLLKIFISLQIKLKCFIINFI